MPQSCGGFKCIAGGYIRELPPDDSDRNTETVANKGIDCLRTFWP